MRHANILLAIDADGSNWSNHQTAKAYKCHDNTVRNVRQRFVEQGLEAALGRKVQQEPSRKRIIDGESEARLISIACGKPPKGRAKWTMQMLAAELVVLKVVNSIASQPVWRTLKKMNLNLT